jgi:Domain of unknown function DUF29
MQELYELREHIIAGRIDVALELIQDLDDMSRKTTIRTIRGFLSRLLMHLIKVDVEKRMTNSWRNSMRDSVLQIADLNLMDNKTGVTVHADAWQEYLENAFISAISAASVEVADGKYTSEELEQLVNKHRILDQAATMLRNTYTLDYAALARETDRLLKEIQS